MRQSLLVLFSFLTSCVYANSYINRIENLKYQCEKVMVVFSGTPGMGKTTVAKALQKRFKAVRLSTDEIRSYYKESGYPPNTSFNRSIRIPFFFFGICHEVLKKKPKLVVMDLSCDQVLQIIKPMADRYHYRLFKVRLNVPCNQVVARIKKRGKCPSGEDLTKMLPYYFKSYDAIEGEEFDSYFDNSDGMYERSLEELVSKVELLL